MSQTKIAISGFIIALHSLLLFTPQSIANTPLNFSAEHNNVQILPQKFEYTLLDSSSIKLGDILIDSKSLNLQLELSRENPKSGKIIFSWPAGLLKEGELTLFNNYGKSLMKEEITLEKIKVLSGEVSDDTLLRNEKALYTTDFLEEEFIEELKYLPFLKFCISKKDRSTRIELCSSELYVSTDDNKLSIKERKSSQKEAVVIINGKEAGDQGIIFLNDKNESINFKAQSESGALLEIVTKLKPIDFKDIVMTDDKKSIKFKASGGFPVKENGVKKLNSNTWEIILPIDFPVFYVQGEGGMPMKQEFNIKGPLPQESRRNFLVSKPIEKTYSANLFLEARSPKGTTVKPKDDLSNVIQKKNQRYTWEIKNLVPNSQNKRYIIATSSDSTSTIGYDVFRGYRFEAQASFSLLTPMNLMKFDIDLTWWMNNLSSGFLIKSSFPASKPDYLTQYSDMEVGYLHRFTKGLNFIDPSYFAGVSYKLLKLNETSFALPGVVVGQKNTPTWYWMSVIADWYQWKIQYFMGQKKETVELKSVYSFDFTNFYSFGSSQFFNYSLGVLKYDNSSTDLSSDQINISAGWTKIF